MALLVLSVDPGEKRTGFCWKLMQSEDVWPTLHKGIVQSPNLLNWVTNEWDRWLSMPHNRFICLIEDFIQRPGLNDQWIKVPTPKVFGFVTLRAMQAGALVIPTNPDTLRVGASLAGIKWTGKSHLRDDLSAESHAAYFCTHGIPKRVRDWLG